MDAARESRKKFKAMKNEFWKIKETIRWLQFDNKIYKIYKSTYDFTCIVFKLLVINMSMIFVKRAQKYHICQ